MTYMYATYVPVNFPSEEQNPSSPPSASPSASAQPAAALTGLLPAALQCPRELPHWAVGVSRALGRAEDATRALGQTAYRLWRYTGDDSSSQGSAAGKAALPVLFVPGNGGSHDMVRSLASETARRVGRLGSRAALSSAGLDWYSAELEGEWSAFDGDILERQVRFVLSALRTIARAHNITRPRGPGSDGTVGQGPTSGPAAPAPGPSHPGLVVVAHSMGGVVAAEALARAAEDPELGPSVASLLVTLASPLTRPPLPGHPSTARFYSAAAGRPRPLVPVVSVDGGLADMQVAPELTDPWSLAPAGHYLHVSLPNAPGAWCPAAHNALVWCNQGVGALGAALVEAAQDAAPLLDAIRRGPPRAPAKSGAARPLSPGADTEGLDPAAALRAGEQAWREAHKPDSLAMSAAEAAAAAAGPPAALPWDWAFRRVARRLRHPAQPYLAAALAEAAALEGRRGAAAGAETEADAVEALLRRADVARAGSAAGGAGCGGANLQWYLQYNNPQVQPLRIRRALRLLPSDLDGAPTTGLMYAWQLGQRSAVGPATEADTNRSAASDGGLLRPRGWVAVVSGAAPCTAFRAWISVEVDRGPMSGSGGGGGGGGGGGTPGREQLEAMEAEARREMGAGRRVVRHDLEVTSLAAPLPAVVTEGRWQVRNKSHWQDIHAGRDYQSRGAWLLALPPALLLPLVRADPGGLDPAWLAEALGSVDPASASSSSSAGEGGAGAAKAGGGGAGGGRAVPQVTVSLVLWLAPTPTHAPAFRLVAAPVLPQHEEPERRLPIRLAPFYPEVVLPRQPRGPASASAPKTRPPPKSAAAARHRASQEAAAAGPPPPLLVPLELPFLTTSAAAEQRGSGSGFGSGPGSGSGGKGVDVGAAEVPFGTNPHGSPGAAGVLSYIARSRVGAAAVAWLGLYRYAALRITVLDSQGRPLTAAAAANATGGGGGGGGGGGAGGGGAAADTCLSPVVLLVGGGGQAGAAELLQTSSNHTHHSLEPCAVHPGGCAAVTAVLDPACAHRLDLVLLYGTQRLPYMLLGHVGRLWLGALLLAAAAITATAAAAPPPPPDGHGDEHGDGKKHEEREQEDGGGLPTPPDSEPEEEPKGQPPTSGLRQRRRQPVQGRGPERAGAVGAGLAAAELQAKQQGRRLRGWPALPLDALRALQAAFRWPSAPTLLLLLASTAALALLLPRLAPPPGGLEDDPPSPASTTHGAATSAPPAAAAGAAGAGAVWWRAVRGAAEAAGLCARPHLSDCGWGLELPPGIRTHVAAAGPAADVSLRGLDWAALAAAAALALVVLAAVLQAVGTALALAEIVLRPIWWIMFVLPYALLPYIMIVLPFVGSAARVLRGRGGAGQGRRGDGNAAAAAAVAAVRRILILGLLLAALCSVAGAASAIPAAALAAAVVALAAALTSRSTPIALDGSPLQQDTIRRRRLQAVAWLLLYGTYGICGAPVVAAAVRRLVVRREAVGTAVGLAAAALQEALVLVSEGRGFKATLLGVRCLLSAVLRALSSFWAASAGGLAAAAAVGRGGGGLGGAVGVSEMVGQAGYLLAAAHCVLLVSRLAAAGAAAAASSGPVDGGQGGEVKGIAAGACRGVMLAGCGLLAVGWWLGAEGAAHVAVAGAAAAQLLAEAAGWA
ncbi:hypothetical protein HYH03_003978 [Edaphochlamys debaryana]|uniref:GPI inositol-deacylase n=1 Tax=Edaphochlamys debaryana TaxID=47281 RepID=A0A835Y8Y7_9CHLO|nr:hypothetical protein HYH03_003978 [Edaphochlamys debaryana]|eukprot:KAG2498228.1 hypothetical protein HYH03_003978 [Edaphochlamys debaryana]